MIRWVRSAGISMMAIGGVVLACTVLTLLILVDESASGLPESARQIQETRKTIISFITVLVGMPLSFLGLWFWAGSWMVSLASIMQRHRGR